MEKIYKHKIPLWIRRGRYEVHINGELFFIHTNRACQYEYKVLKEIREKLGFVIEPFVVYKTVKSKFPPIED